MSKAPLPLELAKGPARSRVPSTAACAGRLGPPPAYQHRGWRVFFLFQIWFAGVGVWLYQSTNIYP